MKKNISINISGIIFHIEEDGYDQLKEYLESINRYFSTFDDSHEIIADIETRIAEIFLAKLKEGQQVIGIEDVEELVATMGSIKDFQAAEEEANFPLNEEEPIAVEDDEGEPLFSKRLYRDNNRKLLAGVLSGLAYYFNIDPLWTRLIYILLFFGVSILPAIPVFLLIAYVVFWIAVPASDELKEEKKIKKMYRDPDGKVLGGVCSGVAAYFGVDVVIIRLLFFAAIFVALTGLILYIILWIILPEAKTLTDKMEMQGQPVTLSNIESNIKKSLNVNSGDENILVKILLFPFRLIAALFDFLSKALGPFMSFLVEAIRVIFGVILAILGISGILAVLIAGGVLIGLFTSGDLNVMYPVPFEMIKNDLTLLPGLASTIALIIPFFFLAILGFMILMKKKVLNPKASWTILAVWLVSIIVLSFTIPPYIQNFQDSGRYSTVNRYALFDKTAILQFNDIGEDEFDLVTLRIRSHQDTVMKLEQEFLASGKSRKDASNNAKMIKYGLDVQDSVLYFDSNLEFEPGARFRRQELKMTLYIPEGQKFMMNEDMKYLIGSFMYKEGYSNRQITGNVWAFENEELKCLSCPVQEEKQEDFDDDWDVTGYNRDYDVGKFSDLEINSAFRVKVKRGSRHSLTISGKKIHVNEVVVDKTGSTLALNYRGKLKRINNKDLVEVYITMPELSSVELGNASKVYVGGFKNDFLDIRLTGAAYADMNIDVKSTNAVIDGASKLIMDGSGERLDLEVKGSATYEGLDYIVDELTVEAQSAATAKVYARDYLKIRTYGVSSVIYSGNAKVDIEKSGKSSVRRD